MIGLREIELGKILLIPTITALLWFFDVGRRKCLNLYSSECVI